MASHKHSDKEDPKRGLEVVGASAAAESDSVQTASGNAGADEQLNKLLAEKQELMETLVRRMEDLAASIEGRRVDGDAGLSPAVRMAAMLKEALAANTIGGTVDDGSRLRAAVNKRHH